MSIDQPMFMVWLTHKKLKTSQNINTGDHMVASTLDFFYTLLIHSYICSLLYEFITNIKLKCKYSFKMAML